MNEGFSRLLFAVVLCAVCLPGTELHAQATIPLPAHSHNDHDRPRPLFSALQLRFASVETEIHLVDNELRVGHDPQDLMRGRTLGNLYLEPLRLLVMRGAGQVYPETTTPLVLLIDIKSDVEATYQQLERALFPYERFLTRFSAEGVDPGAVTVVVSGDGLRELMEDQAERFMGLDGNLSDLTGGSIDPKLIAMISADWDDAFSWRGGGPMPDEEQQQLATLVHLARDNGVKLRFWNAPDIPPVWEALNNTGVDLINTDRIDALSSFLLDTP